MSAVDKMKRVAEKLAETDAVLIGAGAGLTAAAGINYLDEQRFAEVFPGWVKKGFTAQYQLMGYPYWTQLEQWGYYKAHLEYVYFGQRHNPLYQQLYDLVKDKDYFVMTSNVDGLFYKNGFDKSRLYTPQGDYGKIQCTVPCSQQVWDIAPFLEAMTPYYDRDEQVLTDERGIPKCPNCGSHMFIHARIDGSFIDSEHEREYRNLMTWLNKNANKQVLLLDLGSGFNTPTVIRLPMENLTQTMPNAHLVRVNLEHDEVSLDIGSKSTLFKQDIGEFIETLAT
ncbi:hypothetical protein ACPV5O_19810 [Vibrio maritimus]|uniref:hypothetical protein n=1 Tax=Vibrio maritimus TaxID=990268 RepID=UPI004067D5C2